MMRFSTEDEFKQDLGPGFVERIETHLLLKANLQKSAVSTKTDGNETTLNKKTSILRCADRNPGGSSKSLAPFQFTS